MEKLIRPRRKASTLATLVAVLLFSAACGSDDDGANAKEGGDASVIPSDGLAEAQAVVDLYRSRPDGSDPTLVTEPVGKPVPSGEQIYFVSCGAPACDAIGLIVEEAARAVGWTGTVLHTDGSPQQIQNAWTQIVREKPAGAIIAGTPLSQAQPLIAQAAANGTAVVADSVTDLLGSEAAEGVVWETFVPEQFGVLGKVLAAQTLVDASESGNNPSALYLDIPDISIGAVARTEFEDNYATWCPECSVDTLELGLSDIANAPSRIISYLRSHPDVKYLASTNDGSFVGIEAALKAGGIEGVTYYGASPVTANLQAIQDGSQAGTVVIGFYEQMYAAVDAIIRHKVGAELVPGDTDAPFLWLLTDENLEESGFGSDSFPESGLIPLVTDIDEHYRSLWSAS